MMPTLPSTARGDAADVGVADGVIAAEHDREDRPLVDVADRLVDLVEGLFDVGRDDRDVPHVDHVERFPDVDPHLEVVAAVERGHGPHGRAARSGRPGGRSCRRRTARRRWRRPARRARACRAGRGARQRCRRGENARPRRLNRGMVRSRMLSADGSPCSRLSWSSSFIFVEGSCASRSSIRLLTSRSRSIPTSRVAAIAGKRQVGTDSVPPCHTDASVTHSRRPSLEPFAPEGALYHSRVRNLRDCPSLDAIGTRHVPRTYP